MALLYPSAGGGPAGFPAPVAVAVFAVAIVAFAGSVARLVTAVDRR